MASAVVTSLLEFGGTHVTIVTAMEARIVDLSLRLNVLVACMAFAFIGAVLFGAF
jgi:hypothetical protein